jgi:hypothetical protein
MASTPRPPPVVFQVLAPPRRGFRRARAGRVVQAGYGTPSDDGPGRNGRRSKRLVLSRRTIANEPSKLLLKI